MEAVHTESECSSQPAPAEAPPPFSMQTSAVGLPDHDHWSQLWEIFHTALERPPEERDPFVAVVCADSSEMRDQVFALLAAHDRASTFLEQPVLSTDVALSPSAIPGQVDDYRVTRLIGAGGMGVVYEAEQDNPRRAVALKVL